ncbi:MAG: nucleotide-binding domain containing protein, partial [Ilumatobacteraceae bacterium]
QLTHLDVAGWAGDPVGIAVCDVRDDAELDLALSTLRDRPDVLLAGTSAVASSAALDASEMPSRASSPLAPVRPSASSCLVVCGSMHPAAREQVVAAAACGAHVIVDGLPPDETVAGEMAAASSGTVILVPPPMVPDPGRRDAPTVVAASLAERAEELYLQLRPDAVVVIGGDTAAAVLGNEPVQVGGLVEPGAPWSISADGRFVVTRAGGFGDPDALHRLVRTTLGP